MDHTDSAKHVTRTMNPWVLHLQKLGLELMCPLCLNLFCRPCLLPCGHLFCDECVAASEKLVSGCPICKAPYANGDLRVVSFLENIVAIYRSLDAAFHASLSQQGDTGNNDKDCEHKTTQVKSKEFGNKQLKMTQMEPTLLGSLPSFVDTRASYSNISDQYSDCPENYPAKPPGKRNSDDKIKLEVDGTFAAESHLLDSKRQKKLNHEPLGMDVKRHHDSQSVLRTGSLVVSDCKLGPKSGEPLDASALPATSDDSCSNRFACGFCQSSRISEVTEEMLHYANGKPVTGDRATRPDVIHVHSSCINWAPQVYYDVHDTIKNLKSELARGSKLKCSKCGLKGAALGCYAKSCRRSYHFPCATEIPNCRWNNDKHLMLCPKHSSEKFPNEKSRHCNSNDVVVPVPTQIAPQKSVFFWEQATQKQDWVFCASALSSNDRSLLIKFASMIGVSVLKLWSPDVTHVIAATDAAGACTRTLKVLMAISTGKWVLKIDWIKACMESMHPVGEEPYEISLDNHGSRDGPKTGRLRALDNAPKLFNGFSFYFVGDFISGYKEDLQKLVVAAGGNVFRRKEELEGWSNSQDQTTLSKLVLVYNVDSPQGTELGDEVTILWQRASEAQDLATKLGGQVIGHTWLLESIAACRLQPFVN